MKRSIFMIALTSIVALAPLIPKATTLAEFRFADSTQEQAFRSLTEQLRCLVCQNESLAASQADLAQDLRREIYQMMRAGKTQDQIIEFLVARYGDFVLYNPPLKPATYPLWYGPFALFGIASLFLVRTLVRKKKARDTELSAAERARLATLLAEQTKPQDPPR